MSDRLQVLAGQGPTSCGWLCNMCCARRALGCQPWRMVWLRRAMSSRLAERAAARFLVSFFELEAQVDDLLLELAVLLGEVAGVGGQVGLQRNAGDAGSAGLAACGRGGLEGVDLSEQVAVAVEEGAVDSGRACDRGDADLGLVAAGALERGGDPLAAAGGAGLASLPHGLGALAASRDPGGHRVAAAAGRMAGMPSETARCRRTAVTAWSIWARSASVSWAMSPLMRVIRRRMRVISCSAGVASARARSSAPSMAAASRSRVCSRSSR